MTGWKTRLIGLGAALLAAGAAFAQEKPVVFVHGDSDTAGLWMVQMWRFESNGYPRELLRPVDLDHPGARGDNTVAEENRSSTTDVAAQLAGHVARSLIESGADKVHLVGNSRGCQTIRNYLKNGGGKSLAETAVLTGCVHNGVFVFPGNAMGSEYNGAGTFLTALNTAPLLTADVETVTIRSEKYDLYNQPKGDWIGMAGQDIGGRFDGPELEGAENIVLPGIVDHRETAYSPAAFAVMYEAITGQEPETTEIEPEATPVLDGEVSGWADGAPTNLPLEGATVSVFKTDPETGERQGEAVHTKTVGADGRWGPFTADPKQTYEFEVTAQGYPTHHVYRSPFPRSTDVANIRLYPKEGAAIEAKSHVSMMRPRGYFGAERDTITFNGEMAEGVPPGPVPGVWKVHKTFDSAEPRTVVGIFNGETIAARSWPGEGHTAWIELTY